MLDKPLDDYERQDIPRETARVLDKIARLVARNTMSDRDAEALAEQLRIMATQQRVFAELGAWPPMRCPHCHKSTLTPHT